MSIAELIERLEDAARPNYALEVEIFKWLHPEYAEYVAGRGGLVHPQDGEDVRVLSSVRAPNYTSSMDEAYRLGKAVLPGWQMNISIFSDVVAEASVGSREVDGELVFKGSPALALCIAILKAKQAQEVPA